MKLSKPGSLFATAIILTAPITGAATPSFQTLYSFTPGSDGANPQAPLVVGPGGVLYGTTSTGGSISGTVFSLSPPSIPGGAWTEAVLYNFTGGLDGGSPSAGLVLGPGRELYGTTLYGGTDNDGVVFSLTPPASPGAAWTETVLHRFSEGVDGLYPEAGLLRAGNGALYGTTSYGGTLGGGVVFEMIPPSSSGGPWTEKILHSFGAAGDGAHPYAAPTEHAGVLYGTTDEGGTSTNCFKGCGAVFSLSPPTSSGGAWTETVLYSFTGASDGANPSAALVAAANGVLYGTAFYGGEGSGTVFSLTPPVTSGEPWSLTVLYTFSGAAGDDPSGTLLLMPGPGVLYGTTVGYTAGTLGTIFQLKPPSTSGGAWTYSAPITFFGTNGANPYAGLVLGAGGVLYGTTVDGGSSGFGTVFALTL
jgi:uncharacterized repeat protein (TIGR03803 family)